MPFLGILLRVGKQTEVLPGKLMPKVGWFGSGSRFTFATAKMGLRRFVHFRVGRRRRRMVEMDKMVEVVENSCFLVIRLMMKGEQKNYKIQVEF